MSFVIVPADYLRAKLAGLGFMKVAGSWREEVYERRHHRDARYCVRVYTTIPVGSANACACGRDAIRVVALVEVQPGQHRGVYKAKRIFRTGTVEGVLERMTERLREAYGFVNETLKGRRR